MVKLIGILVGLLLPLSVSAAELSKTTQDEVNHLLVYLEKSGCQFNRNGSWHSAAKARAHLETKYDYLSKRGLVKTTEDFIERAASQSSTTGRAYQVKCGNGRPVTSGEWLADELHRYRETGKER